MLQNTDENRSLVDGINLSSADITASVENRGATVITPIQAAVPKDLKSQQKKVLKSSTGTKILPTAASVAVDAAAANAAVAATAAVASANAPKFHPDRLNSQQTKESRERSYGNEKATNICEDVSKVKDYSNRPNQMPKEEHSLKPNTNQITNCNNQITSILSDRKSNGIIRAIEKLAALDSAKSCDVDVLSETDKLKWNGLKNNRESLNLAGRKLIELECDVEIDVCPAASSKPMISNPFNDGCRKDSISKMDLDLNPITVSLEQQENRILDCELVTPINPYLCDDMGSIYFIDAIPENGGSHGEDIKTPEIGNDFEMDSDSKIDSSDISETPVGSACESVSQVRFFQDSIEDLSKLNKENDSVIKSTVCDNCL